MPAMHMLRLVLMMLCNPKTFSRGLFMLRRSLGKAAGGAASGVGAAPPPDTRTWRKSFEVVFVDSTGWLNLAASMSKAALAQACAAAAYSIQLLNMGTPEAFDAVFATRQRLVSDGEGLGRAQQPGQGWTMSQPMLAPHLRLGCAFTIPQRCPGRHSVQSLLRKHAALNAHPSCRTVRLPAQLQLLSQRRQPRPLPHRLPPATTGFTFAPRRLCRALTRPAASCPCAASAPVTGSCCRTCLPGGEALAGAAALLLGWVVVCRMVSTKV